MPFVAHRRRAAVLAAAIAGQVGAMSPAGATGAPADPVFGHWLTQNGRAIVEITPCGPEACGHVAWTLGRAEKAAQRQADAPAGDPPGRPVPRAGSCGRPLLGELAREEPGVWTGGFIRDPRNDRRYDARLTVIAPDRLEVHGYFGLPIFGRTQVWTREPDDRGGC